MIDVGPFAAHWEVALPGLLIAATAMIIMMADVLVAGVERDALAGLALVGLATAAGAALWLWAQGAGGGFGETLRGDRVVAPMAVAAAHVPLFQALARYLVPVRDHSSSSPSQ